MGRQRRILEILGTDSKHDPSAHILSESWIVVEGTFGQRQPMRSELDHVTRPFGALDKSGLDEVHRRGSYERRNESVRGSTIELARSPDLLQIALVNDCDPFAQCHGLSLIVSHVDGGHVECCLLYTSDAADDLLC